jgi:hypothetical protein
MDNEDVATENTIRVLTDVLKICFQECFQNLRMFANVCHCPCYEENVT